MSVREDNENKNCPSRGLGIAAAAIGVGVGAALYYFFSKRQEPDNEGATTSGWNCEQPHTLSETNSSFTTISENSTTDTSINSNTDSEMTDYNETNTSFNDSDVSSSETETSQTDTTDANSSDTDQSIAGSDLSMSESDFSDGDLTDLMSNGEYLNSSIGSDMGPEWDLTNSSLDIPNESRRSVAMMVLSSVITNLTSFKRKRPVPEARVKQSEKVFRDRSWAPEECAICFDMMSNQQDVFALPCTHRFHQNCISTWLQEKQTCPVCRKLA